MILHIIQYEKFTADYIQKINLLFDKKEHLFFVHGDKTDSGIKSIEDDNIVFSSQYKGKAKIARALFRLMKKADKIILHSIFCPGFLFLTLIAYVHFGGKKYFWNIWGADLYDAYRKRNQSIGLRIKEVLRRYFIRHIHAVGYIKGDFDYLKKHYKTKATFFTASYAYEFSDIPSAEDGEDAVNILLGNSANPSCQYPEAIDMLRPYANRNIKAYCILSYPTDDKAYINKIVSYGKAVLGERFIPLTGFMPYKEYMALLSNIDLAVFNNNRQQALGNIASLLYYGKRVYVNPANACLEYFQDFGCTLYSTEELCDESIQKGCPSEVKKENRCAILNFFSDEAFRQRWESIFTASW